MARRREFEGGRRGRKGGRERARPSADPAPILWLSSILSAWFETIQLHVYIVLMCYWSCTNLVMIIIHIISSQLQFIWDNSASYTFSEESSDVKNLEKVPIMSWSRTWKSNHSVEGCCINVDPWRVFAVLSSKMYRPKFGFFSHFGQRGSWRLKKMVLNAHKWGWIDQCRGIWHNQVSDDDNEGKLWYQTSWWRWR